MFHTKLRTLKRPGSSREGISVNWLWHTAAGVKKGLSQSDPEVGKGVCKLVIWARCEEMLVKQMRPL